MTLAGLSRVNIENTLAVTSAALAIGLSADQVADGLREFDPGADNPGRMNVWTLPVADDHGDEHHGGGEISVVIDLADNEAGLQALIEIARGIKPPGGRLLLGVGTAGDRTDDVFVTLGQIAALAADVVEIAHKDEYLRGRPMSELGALIKEGAEHAGVTITRGAPGRGRGLGLTGLPSTPPGDVIALMTHQDRAQVDAWLAEHGGRRDAVADLRDQGAAGERRLRLTGPSQVRTNPQRDGESLGSVWAATGALHSVTRGNMLHVLPRRIPP